MSDTDAQECEWRCFVTKRVIQQQKQPAPDRVEAIMTVVHFKEAQASCEYSGPGFAIALEEMEQGHKRGCWMWYIFPQLQGLGRSHMAKMYALSNREHTVVYLQDVELSANLLAITRVVAAQIKRCVPIRTLMGFDVRKLVSSMTLFEIVTEDLAFDAVGAENATFQELASLCREILEATTKGGFPRCERTLTTLHGKPSATDAPSCKVDRACCSLEHPNRTISPPLL
mmetsp:Transcript_23874/g.39469  ORF Transcript_23874/g.39469 Transcript_23874/m.39469 type:complete len:228 (-) Transcript_23874:211-894(-)|eukprot:CAMPEP_0119025922 /NCGR_PEP_ID=MMETSP1176-20130426/34528_1 /TAXON_ID=265551 /ORGANISM="Synedropsis recta cf, Strain CCMP1620" /LENGTH=227 /DNA_ID=CAMNT_0006981533 /DNA_START=201 /DNA_END=884 /DNA_ORIENTATION=+